MSMKVIVDNVIIVDVSFHNIFHYNFNFYQPTKSFILQINFDIVFGT